MYFKALRLSATLHSDIWILFKKYSGTLMSLPCGSAGKQSDCNEGDLGSIPGCGKIPWRRKWQPTAVFLPGESQGRGSLVGCCLWGCTELDTTEAT